MIYNIVDNTPTTMRVVLFEYVTVDGRQKTLIKTHYSIPINEAMKEDKKLRAMGHTHQDELDKEPVKTEAEIRAEIKAEMMTEMKAELMAEMNRNVVPDTLSISQAPSINKSDDASIVETVKVEDVEEAITKVDLNPCDVPVETPKRKGRPKKSK